VLDAPGEQGGKGQLRVHDPVRRFETFSMPSAGSRRCAGSSPDTGSEAVRFQALRRNEHSEQIAPASVRKWMSDPASFEPQLAGREATMLTQRNTLALRDVAYIIEAYPHVYHRPRKNHRRESTWRMFNRRVEKGQCFQRRSECRHISSGELRDAFGV